VLVRTRVRAVIAEIASALGLSRVRVRDLARSALVDAENHDADDRDCNHAQDGAAQS
jgi:hypothetical protein